MKKTFRVRRIVSLLLAVIMVAGVFPFSIFAEDGEKSDPAVDQVAGSLEIREPADPQNISPSEASDGHGKEDAGSGDETSSEGLSGPSDANENGKTADASGAEKPEDSESQAQMQSTDTDSREPEAPEVTDPQEPDAPADPKSKEAEKPEDPESKDAEKPADLKNTENPEDKTPDTPETPEGKSADTKEAQTPEDTKNPETPDGKTPDTPETPEGHTTETPEGQSPEDKSSDTPEGQDTAEPAEPVSGEPEILTGLNTLSAEPAGTAAASISFDETAQIPVGAYFTMSETVPADTQLPPTKSLSPKKLLSAPLKGSSLAGTAGSASGTPGSLALSRSFDLTLNDADGNPIQPAEGSKVQLSITMPEIADKNLYVRVYHHRETESGTERELLPLISREGSTITTETTGFSTFTVEFYYGDSIYVLEGGTTIFLSELIEALGINEFTVEDVASVSFSDPSLVSVTQDGSDWILSSLAAFDTEEKLIIDLKNGQSMTLKVTDAREKITRDQLDHAVDNKVTYEASIEFANGEVYTTVNVPSGRVSTIMPDYAKETIFGTRASNYYNNQVNVYEGNTQIIQAGWALNINDEYYADEQNRTDSNGGRNSVIADINSSSQAAENRYLGSNRRFVIRISDGYYIYNGIVYRLSNNGTGDGTATVYDKVAIASEREVAKQFIYNGHTYTVNEFYTSAAANRAYLDGSDISVSEDMIDELLGTGEYSIPVVKVTPDDDMTGYKEGVSNSTSDYMIWKKAKSTGNKLTIDLAFFQKMNNSTHLDFIYFIDETATMSSEAQKLNTVNTVQRVVTRSLISKIAEAILDQPGYDNRMAFVFQAHYPTDNLYDTTKQFYSDYSSAKSDIFNHYCSGSTTDTAPARDQVIALASQSIGAGRQPVVIIVSDFQNGFSNSSGAVIKNHASQNNYEVYCMNVDNEPRTAYMNNFSTSAENSYRAYNTDYFLDSFTQIFKDAIGYYISETTEFIDQISIDFSGKTITSPTFPHIDENGKLEKMELI